MKIKNFFSQGTRKFWLYSFMFLSVLILVFYSGIYVGMSVQPRSALSLNKCEKNCWSKNEAAGLLGSIGIKLNLEQVAVEKQNDTCFSIKMPNTALKFHYVMIPKKDIKDIGDLNDEDTQIVNDCIKIATEHIRDENLTKYQFLTNGPEYQHVRYLHFHLRSKSDTIEN